nr:hypothetical protein GCM10020093_008390 [Planobispora longispora]
MDVGLVPGVEDEDVVRGVEHPVQRDGQLDHPEVHAQVSSGGAHLLDQEAADPRRQVVELRPVQVPQRGRADDLLQGGRIPPGGRRTGRGFPGRVPSSITEGSTVWPVTDFQSPRDGIAGEGGVDGLGGDYALGDPDRPITAQPVDDPCHRMVGRRGEPGARHRCRCASRGFLPEVRMFLRGHVSDPCAR